ncbi:ribonuclease H-like domain-containing protein [Tanacetum coccineum]
MNVAQPIMTSFKTAHLNVKRNHLKEKKATKNQIWVPKVPTGRTKIPTIGSNVPTAKPTGAADLGNKGKAVKGSARWIWKPKENTSSQGSNFNGGNIDDKGYWDSGCSRHMTGNISYLSKYEPYDGGYVSFGYGGGKITGKGTIKTVARNISGYRFAFPKVLNDAYPVFAVSKETHKASCKPSVIMGVSLRIERWMNSALRKLIAKLPVTFWAEAVSTACYVQNRVLVNKSQNKTPYELFNGRSPAIGFLRPFGCHVMILNTLDHLGKFDAKGDEGYFVGYSLSSKAFRVFNKRTKKVEENLHVDFLENKPIEKGAGPNWLFDIDSLTNSMNYVSVVVAGTLILAI